MTDGGIAARIISHKKEELFARHQKLLEARDGCIGDGSGEIAAFFLPRRNFFWHGRDRPVLESLGLYREERD